MRWHMEIERRRGKATPAQLACKYRIPSPEPDQRATSKCTECDSKPSCVCTRLRPEKESRRHRRGIFRATSSGIVGRAFLTLRCQCNRVAGIVREQSAHKECVAF